MLRREPGARGLTHEDGYAMAALLVALAIMAVFLGVALPAWRTATQREKETELIFRGQQYARAIALFQRKYANTFPPNLDILLNEHFLRKKYKDPMTADGVFQVVYVNQQASAQPSAGGTAPQQGGTVPQQGQPGRPATGIGASTVAGPQGGIIGVASKSTATSLRVYNGHEKYNEWVFVAQQASNRVNAPNASQTPTGGVNIPGGAGGAGGIGGANGRGGRGGQPVPGGRGNPPGGRGQAPNPNQPGPFGRPGGPGAPAQPFGVPFGGGGPAGRGGR